MRLLRFRKGIWLLIAAAAILFGGCGGPTRVEQAESACTGQGGVSSFETQGIDADDDWSFECVGTEEGKEYGVQ